MFDMGFSELLVCGLIALIVLGPERLPALASRLGRFTGQARMYLRHLSNELERESRLQELREGVKEAEQILRSPASDAESGTVKKPAAAAKPAGPADE